MKDRTVTAIGIILVMIGSFSLGMYYEQYVIGERIWPHQKDCYNEQDLQIIVYGQVKK
jgi:hypothetical protein